MHAVDDVSFAVREGETLGLVGESGCGKSTLGRTIVRLLEPTDGQIIFQGQDDRAARRAGCARCGGRCRWSSRIRMRRSTRASASARSSATRCKIHRIGDSGERKRAVEELLETVGLSPEHYNRFPHEFSGGQRQRIGIARALALRPKLIVADEPVSALDVSIQSQMLNLLDDLQNEFQLTYLFIAHDLGVVRHVSDRIAVMYLGKIVELSPAEELYRGRSCRTPRRSSRRFRSRTPTWPRSGSGSCSRATFRARSTRRAAAASIRAAAMRPRSAASSSLPSSITATAISPPATTR